MARIVETRPAPPREPVDPVTLDIIENALRNIREEMDATLFRTAMSPGIREQHDEFPLLADRQGRMVVGQFGSFIHGFLDSFDGDIRDGDVFFTSDPYHCDGAISHANDWLVLIPIFRDGLLVGWASMFGHMTDVGGKVPGSLPTDATTIYEEGVVVPPFRLFSQGELNSDAFEVILNQVRIPEWNRADLNGVVAGCRVAYRRVRELCDRFGEQTYLSALEELLDRNHRAMRELIVRHVPTDPVSFTDYVDDDGLGRGPHRVRCTMWREDDRVVLDCTGTAPQAAGPINYYLNTNILKMYFGIYMIMVFDPQILWNDGFYPLVDVRFPEASLLTPRAPAALSCRTHALGRVFDVLGGLLGQQQSHFLNGAGFSSSPHLMYSGRYPDGQWFQLYQIGFGGVPGRRVGDGPDGHSMWPSFTNVPNEYLERYYPLRIERYESVADSGGPGEHRGGNGVEVAYRFLQPGEISIHDDRWFTYPWGVNGGQPGARSRKVLERRGGTVEVLPSKCDQIRVGEGDLLRYITWGGGGWGDPLARPPEVVATEVQRGLVTPAGARRYGVVVDPEGLVDPSATERLRGELLATRPPLRTFDTGPDLDELRERCRAETGLPAPVPPDAPDGPAASGALAGRVAPAASGALVGKVAVVTAGDTGLGRASAVSLAEAGARVVLTGTEPGELEITRRAVVAVGGDGLVAAPEDAPFAQAAAAYGGVDIAVALTTAPVTDGPGELSDDRWDAAVGTGLGAVFDTVRAAARHLRDGGAIVCVGSVAGPVFGWGGHAPYATVQAATVGLVRSLAEELAGRGVRANAVLSGPPVMDGQSAVGSEPVVGGEPADVAGVVRFLAGPDAGFVTGQSVVVDGGLASGSVLRALGKDGA